MTTLPVPYYSQTAEFSCGPACALMVLGYFDRRIPLDRTTEFELWRECNMIGIRGANPYGMAIPFLKRGYRVTLLTEREETFPFSRFSKDPKYRARLKRRGFTEQDLELSKFAQKTQIKMARQLGLRLRYGHPRVNEVRRAHSKRAVPIALVHMGVIHNFDIPHWVVVTGVDDSAVTFHDPYPPKGRRNLKLSYEKFQQIIDDIGTKMALTPSLLIVDKRN